MNPASLILLVALFLVQGRPEYTAVEKLDIFVAALLCTTKTAHFAYFSVLLSFSPYRF